jgi:transposase-like protein
MFVPRQQYPRELKIATMRELDSGKSVGEVARTCQVSPKRLETWRGEWRARGEQLAFPGHAAQSQAKVDGQRIPELKRKIGQQAMEIDFLKKSCGVSGSKPCPSSPMAASDLRRNPGSGESGGRSEPALPGGRSQSGRVLPFSAAS